SLRPIKPERGEVCFPLRDGDGLRPPGKPWMATTRGSRAVRERMPLRILLAEDNEVLRLAMGGLLRSLGHTVQEATNGCEAIEAAARTDYDIVILDIQMPGRDGIDVARHIRQSSPDASPHIVGVSAEAVGARRTGAGALDQFLTKPVCVADLQAVLARFDRQ